jgi:HK97 family phage major capsid protein
MNARQKERADQLAKAQGIVNAAKAGGRDLTADESTTVEGIFARIDEIDRQEKSAKEADALMARLGGSGDATPTGTGAGFRWAKSVSDRMTATASAGGVKALLTGEVATGPAVDVAALPDKPTRLLDLIPRADLSENTFAYLRQTVATNNAAVVADGALKPTSVYTFDEIEDRARVIAHLSEPFPIRYADDHTSMVEVLSSQMFGGVWSKIEDLIVNGTGAGEQWAGILATAGTTTVPFATDVVTTLRKARTALEIKGERVTAVAMNPADVEALDLIRENGATGGFLLDGTAYEMIFGRGVQGVPSIAVPAGTAIAGDWSQVRLRVRQGVHSVAATQAGDLFDKNQMKLRTEGRYGFQFLRPQALAVVDLTA